MASYTWGYFNLDAVGRKIGSAVVVVDAGEAAGAPGQVYYGPDGQQVGLVGGTGAAVAAQGDALGKDPEAGAGGGAWASAGVGAEVESGDAITAFEPGGERPDHDQHHDHSRGDNQGDNHGGNHGDNHSGNHSGEGGNHHGNTNGNNHGNNEGGTHGNTHSDNHHGGEGGTSHSHASQEHGHPHDHPHGHPHDHDKPSAPPAPAAVHHNEGDLELMSPGNSAHGGDDVHEKYRDHHNP